MLKEEIAAVDSLVKDNRSGLLKDLLLSSAGGKAEETETAEMQKDDARFRAVWYWIERTLQNREINLNAEKYSFLTTMLNLFACYIFFAGSISVGNRRVWDRLWNDETLILNPAGECVAFGVIIDGKVVFESLNVGYPLTIPAKIAVAFMEGLGNATYEFYKNGGTL